MADVPAAFFIEYVEFHYDFLHLFLVDKNKFAVFGVEKLSAGDGTLDVPEGFAEIM